MNNESTTSTQPAWMEISDPAQLSPKPVVSVLMIAYNHEPYLAEAIEGVLAQVTEFAIELIIGEDCSTDNTRAVAFDYQRRFPHIIRVIYSDRNVGMHGNLERVIEASRGAYIALCEGDDYWTSSLKLQRQVEWLHTQPDIDMSFHPAFRVNTQTNQKQIFGQYADGNSIVSAEEIVGQNSGHIPTASIVLRQSAMDEFKRFNSKNPYITVGDIFIQFFGSERGGALFINEPMSVYRAFVPGSFTERFSKNQNLRFSHFDSRIRSYVELNKISKGRFKQQLDKENAKWLLYALRSPGLSFVFRTRLLAKYFRFLDLKTLVTYTPLTLVPGLLSISLKLYRNLNKRPLP